MFSKAADPVATPPRPAPGPASNSRSVLAADLRISGDIRSTGSIEILGEVDGTVEAYNLIVGGEGRMTGDIAAATVEIKGRHTGRIGCDELTLRAAAQVTADIGYSTLIIESGAQVEGRFARNKA